MMTLADVRSTIATRAGQFIRLPLDNGTCALGWLHPGLLLQRSANGNRWLFGICASSLDATVRTSARLYRFSGGMPNRPVGRVIYLDVALIDRVEVVQ